MTLQEAEVKLSKVNEELEVLLREREKALKERNTAFHAENPENITCVDENIEDCHRLYLLNGESKMFACLFGRFEMKGSQDDFYRALDNSMHMINTANGRDFDLPEYQKNLIYAKAIEIREDFTSWNNTSRNS